jgi:hypothetical protein
MTAGEAVGELFRRVPEARACCSIEGTDMGSQPYVVFHSLGLFIAAEVREGRGGLDCAVDRASEWVEELAASDDSELEGLVRHAFLPSLMTELGSVTADLASLGRRTRSMLRDPDEAPPRLWTPGA